MSLINLQTISDIHLDAYRWAMLELSLIVDRRVCRLKTGCFPSRVRFIKLGASGAWAARAFSENVVFFEAPGVSHEHCLKQDWDVVEKQVEAITSGKQNKSEGLSAYSESAPHAVHFNGSM